MVVKWLNSNLSANIGGTKAKYFASLQFIVARWYKKNKDKNKNYYFNTLSLSGFGGREEVRKKLIKKLMVFD